MPKLSAVVITFNEEANIGRCLDSVAQIADEIVVVDSFSKDRTKQICLEKGVRFLEHAFESHIDQKNYALSQARYDHVLSLDADEYLCEELAQSIIEIKKTWPADAYSMNRLSSYAGKWIRHGDWYPDKKIRLWNRRVGIWGGENPHDRVILNKGVRVKHLKGDLLHKAYRNAHETLEKIQRYSEIFARENVGKRTSTLLKIHVHSLFAFFRSFILKRGFLDGYAGLMVAGAVANHVFYKYSKLYELNRYAQLGKTIVISRTDNLGDVILTIPLAGYLKSRMPGCKIYFIGQKYTQTTIESSGYIDGFFDRQVLLESPEKLKSVSPDSILYVFPDLPLARALRSVNIAIRVGTAHRLFHWFHCNRLVFFSRLRSPLHESQLNFKLLKPFLLYYDIATAELPPFYGLRVPAVSKPVNISPDRFNIILHPKSKGHGREWPLQRYYELCSALSPEYFAIYITGLPNEGENMRTEMPALFELRHVTDLTGRTTFPEMMDLVSRVDVLVASGTGVLHLGAALGKPVVGLFPPLKPIHPGRWRPIGKDARFLVIDKKCRQCVNSTDCACIKAISAQNVLDLINQIHQRNAVGRKSEAA